jgi:DNA-3-methyladenine glycosylase I
MLAGVKPKALRRCPWAGDDPAMIAYHDDEWGVPVHDDRTFFEFLILEGAQAGLSWSTILRKRAGYRAAFAGFNAARVAKFGPSDVERLMGDAGIVRNRLKIAATITNAQQVLEVAREHGSFDRYIWAFVAPDNSPRAGVGARGGHRRPRSMKDVPATSPESDALSADLKRRGFRFVGSTIMYAFMQATGLVDDHIADCFRARSPRRPVR